MWAERGRKLKKARERGDNIWGCRWKGFIGLAKTVFENEIAWDWEGHVEYGGRPFAV